MLRIKKTYAKTKVAGKTEYQRIAKAPRKMNLDGAWSIMELRTDKAGRTRWELIADFYDGDPRHESTMANMIKLFLEQDTEKLKARFGINASFNE